MKNLKNLLEVSLSFNKLDESSILGDVEDTLSVNDIEYEMAISYIRKNNRSVNVTLPEISCFLHDWCFYKKDIKIALEAEDELREYADDENHYYFLKYLLNIAKTCFDNRSHWKRCFLTIYVDDNNYERHLIDEIGKEETWMKGLKPMQQKALQNFNDIYGHPMDENWNTSISFLKDLKKWYFGTNKVEEIQIYGIPNYLSKEQEKFIEELVKNRRV